MKTNQIMLRKMGDIPVEQRTKDGYFNATALLRHWNDVNPDKERRLDVFWDATHLNEFMAEVAENELGLKSQNFRDLKNALSKTVRGKMAAHGCTRFSLSSSPCTLIPHSSIKLSNLLLMK